MKNILKKLLVLSTVVVGIGSATAAELKVASVNMEKLFTEHHLTKKTKSKVMVDQERIQKSNSERLTNINALNDEIEKLTKQRNDQTISDKRRLDLDRKIRIKISEAKAADNERRQWLGRQNKALSEQVSDEQRVILDKIRDKVSKYAREQDFDIVIDKSALSSSRVNVFAFVKDKFDITDALLKDLNSEAEAE